MTEEMTDDTAELDRLREHNKQLLTELKTERVAAKAAQEALQAAQAAETQWRERWHAAAVMAPLEADLRGAAAGPVKYLRDVVTDLGLLKMRADAEGIERPIWLDEKGEPADMKRWTGLSGYLYAMHASLKKAGAPGAIDLAACIKWPSGGGATSTGSTSIVHAPTTVPAPAPVTMPLGLR